MLSGACKLLTLVFLPLALILAGFVGSFSDMMSSINQSDSLMDLTMLELQNSCERELDEWAALFSRADARFKFLGGRQPAGSDMWIMQARWEGGDGDV